MQQLLVIFSLAIVVQCHILPNANSVKIYPIFGEAVTVQLEYPPIGSPIVNCCINTRGMQQNVLAGAMFIDAAHLNDHGYNLLRLDFVNNIMTCHLLPSTQDRSDLTSSLCSPLHQSTEYPDTALTCPDGWNLLQNTCFMINYSQVTWRDSRVFCQQSGGDLGIISSEFQQTALSRMITSDTWIGLKLSSDDQTYVWTDDSTLNYTSWARDDQESHDQKQCVFMSQNQDFLWNIEDCTSMKGILCSMPGNPVITTHQRNNNFNMITPATPLTTQTTTTPSPTTASTAPANRQCENTWRQYKSQCYMEFQEKMNYFEASLRCKSHGSFLASVTSDEEYYFIKDLITETVFIGLNDVAKETHFVWEDNSSLTFTRWKDGEPNNAGDGEDCTTFEKNGDWNDVPCNFTRKYLCKKSL